MVTAVDPTPPKRVLIVSPSFPPLNAPDMQRIRMSLPHYRESGWEPVVLCVSPEVQAGVVEPELLQTVPADIAVHASGALQLRLCRAVGIGNLGLRAWFALLRLGSKVIRRDRIDLVYFSNTQFLTFLLGRIWRWRHGVPYVIDLQDPWRTDYYERPGARPPPGGWKYLFARWQARVLEGWAFRKASAVISVSESYLSDLDNRYPWFRTTPRAVIRFGASELDLRVARALPPPAKGPSGVGRVRFVYTGAAGPIMPHAIRVLFRAIRTLRDQSPEQARRLRFEFLGTSYAAPGQGRKSVEPIAAEYGLDDIVHESPDRLGHLECLRIQAEADVLLLLGSSDLAYSPSKIYPYFLANRPMLSVVFEESRLEEILRELSCSVVASFTEETHSDDAQQMIIRFLEAALAGYPPGFLPERNTTYFEKEYLAPALTQRQCAVFSTALSVAHGIAPTN